MKNKYISIFLVSFTLSTSYFFWPKLFPKIETKNWKENSVTKYLFFKSRKLPSGELSGLFSLTTWEWKISGYLDCVNGDEIFNIFFYFQKYGMVGDNEKAK